MVVQGGCYKKFCNVTSFTSFLYRSYISFQRDNAAITKIAFTNFIDCADYTLTLTNSSAVSSSETEFYNDLGPKVRECLSYCLSTSAACTISYETSQEECTVYTECLDNCGIISAPSTWSIYTKSCGNNLTGLLINEFKISKIAF